MAIGFFFFLEEEKIYFKITSFLLTGKKTKTSILNTNWNNSMLDTSINDNIRLLEHFRIPQEIIKF